MLDGDSLLFDDVVENSVVKDLLFNYMTPENTRVDLMSSLFGRDGDDDTNKPTDEQYDIIEQDHGVKPAFDKENAGPPMIEPRFGTKFWMATLSSDTLAKWSYAAMPQFPSPDLLLDLPPQNPFIPTQLDLKPLPGSYFSCQRSSSTIELYFVLPHFVQTLLLYSQRMMLHTLF